MAAGFLAGRLTAQQHMSTTAPAAVAADLIAPAQPVENASRNEAPPLPVAVAPPVSSDWNEQAWDDLLATPATLARNARLAEMLEKLAATDPQKTMALAQAEKNLKLRDTLVDSALHGWARLAPADAANFALALTDAGARDSALKSVFDGAVIKSPEDAVRLANSLMQQNPGEASSYGNSMVDALCESGNFAAATQLAGSGDQGQQSIWMAEAYSKWAELQPEAAAKAAAAIDDPAQKNEALHGVIGGWAQADPAGLTAFLGQLPAGGDRGQMLGQALESWVRLDPTAAAQWINANADQLGTDLDAGMKSLATLNELPPATAVAWSETINDGQLRSQALTDVLRNWLQTDFSSARNYFQTTQNLLPADRQQISEIITSMSTQAAAQ